MSLKASVCVTSRRNGISAVSTGFACENQTHNADDSRINPLGRTSFLPHSVFHD
ncbi:hypothetical protein RBSWK_02394 [Rhodopirellula baltica SWK14]|uniref:Uncharacterized protein n=1 Tax=Rhodopirellula baltica SWK14 TaxID=993516 RepID=L7CKR8_RHOBT|nr:hypothetical protein RBSWK_02394 [Rhodopirellula baltica SWK14]